MSDAKGALTLLDALPPAKTLLADKGYDADWLLEALEDKGTVACIPARRGRKKRAKHDRKRYKQRHRIENLFARLKDWRRIAIPYDRCGELFRSATAADYPSGPASHRRAGAIGVLPKLVANDRYVILARSS